MEQTFKFKKILMIKLRGTDRKQPSTQLQQAKLCSFHIAMKYQRS